MTVKKVDNDQNKKRPNLLKWDILICFVLPFVIWRYISPYLGDRNTIFLVATIGLIYSFVDFIRNRQFNFIVVYSLILSIASNLIELMSSNSTQLMINIIWFNAVSIMTQLLLWKFVDSVPKLYFINGGIRLGYSKQDSINYFERDIFKKSFMYMAFAYIGKDIYDVLIRLYYLQNGIEDAFAKMTQLSNIAGMALSILMSYWGFMLINKANKGLSEDQVKVDSETV